MASSRAGSQDDVAVERIACASDPRVDVYRSVRDADLLRGRRLFVAEGRLVVRRVIEDDRFAVESLLVNDASLHDLDDAIARLDAAVPVLVCPTAALRDLTGFDLHRGCLALVRRPAPTPPAALIAAAGTIVVHDGVSNADNVGGILRNAAAFAVDGVLCSPTTCDPLYRKSIRTSMGAALQVPFARGEPSEGRDGLRRLDEAGVAIVALTPRAPPEPLDAFAARPRPPRLALVVGAEGTGLTPAVEAA